MPANDNLNAPIAVNATPANDQISAAVRTVVLLISVVTALAGLASKHDLAGFIAYVQSAPFITAAGLVMGAGTFAWGQWKTRHRAKQLATIAADPRVPDSVAVTK